MVICVVVSPTTPSPVASTVGVDDDGVGDLFRCINFCLSSLVWGISTSINRVGASSASPISKRSIVPLLWLSSPPYGCSCCSGGGRSGRDNTCCRPPPLPLPAWMIRTMGFLIDVPIGITTRRTNCICSPIAAFGSSIQSLTDPSMCPVATRVASPALPPAPLPPPHQHPHVRFASYGSSHRRVTTVSGPGSGDQIRTHRSITTRRR